MIKMKDNLKDGKLISAKVYSLLISFLEKEPYKDVCNLLHSIKNNSSSLEKDNKQYVLIPIIEFNVIYNYLSNKKYKDVIDLIAYLASTERYSENLNKNTLPDKDKDLNKVDIEGELLHS